jgi:ribosome maturation protein Sdo1
MAIRPSRSTLMDVFGTQDEIQVIEYILNEGQVHTTRLKEGHPKGLS